MNPALSCVIKKNIPESASGTPDSFITENNSFPAAGSTPEPDLISEDNMHVSITNIHPEPSCSDREEEEEFIRNRLYQIFLSCLYPHF